MEAVVHPLVTVDLAWIRQFDVGFDRATKCGHDGHDWPRLYVAEGKPHVRLGLRTSASGGHHATAHTCVKVVE